MNPNRNHPLNLDAAVKGSEAARLFLARVSESANGWTISNVSPDTLAGEHIYTYCCDFATCQSWMACINYQDFTNRIEEIRVLPCLWQEVVDTLESDIDVLLAGCLDPDRSDATASTSDVEIDLQNLHESICNFAGTTKLAFDRELNQPGSHFLVLRYGGQFEGSIFRPLMIPAHLAQGTGSLPVDQFRTVLESMVERDVLEHPEWFGL